METGHGTLHGRFLLRGRGSSRCYRNLQGSRMRKDAQNPSSSLHEAEGSLGKEAFTGAACQLSEEAASVLEQLGFSPLSTGVPKSIRGLRQGLPTGNDTSPLKEGPEVCIVPPPPTHTQAISPLVGLWQESMAQSWEETSVHMPGPAGVLAQPGKRSGRGSLLPCTTVSLLPRPSGTFLRDPPPVSI